MISRHQHKGGQHQAADLRTFGKLPFHTFQRGIALHRGKIHPVTGALQHMLHLRVGGIGKVGGSVTHEYQRLILSQRRQPVQQGLRHGGVVFLPVKQRHPHGNLHPQTVRFQLGQHFLVFLAVHDVGGLDGNVSEAFLLQPLHGLSNIFNLHPVPLF